MSNNKNQQTEEETDEIMEKLQADGDRDITKHECANCNGLIGYHDSNADEWFDYEGELTHSPNERMIDAMDDTYVAIRDEDQGKSICEGCTYEWSTHLTIGVGGEEYNFPFNYVCFNNEHGKGEELGDDIMDDAKKIMASRGYHRIDGWRGYNTVTPPTNKFAHLELAFNSLDMHHSQALIKKKKELFSQAVKELEIPIFYLTARTGNFASYTDVYVRLVDKSICDKVSSFILEFTGDSDPRWDVGVMMHFDSDKASGDSVVESLKTQSLPDWFEWKSFIQNYDEIMNTIPTFKEGNYSDLDDGQLLGVFASKGAMGLEVGKMMLILRDLGRKKKEKDDE